MKKFVLYILFLLPFTGISQIEEDEIPQALVYNKILGNLNYRSQIEQSALYFKDQKTVHSSVKPIFRKTVIDSDNLSKFNFNKGWSKTFGEKTKNTFLEIYPLADIQGGIELSKSTEVAYIAGAGGALNFGYRNFFLNTKILPYYSSGGHLFDSINTNYNQDFGTDRALAPNTFYRGEIVGVLQANKFFTFSGGIGKNFFGEGYRSLLLSDNGAAQPFFKIETSFAGIKYVNLYNFWKDNTVDPNNKSLDIRKFSAIHYLSWNITRDINLSVFETVVWQGKDTLTNRGFDFNYINPIVFYRPVEYGLGSSDNVLLGANLSYKINKNHNIYAQFILDEFLLSELRAKSRWWANKFGGQIGYKSNRFLMDDLYFQIEFNGVRPFTYSHKSSVHSYGHMNSSVTHPIGANFFEVLNILSYKKKKHRFTNKMTFSAYGADTDSISYGQDIFKSYSLRDGTYGHLTMQGLRMNVFNETLIYEYELLPKINMYLIAAYNWRHVNTSLGSRDYHSFTIGIKSRIWNSYNDF